MDEERILIGRDKSCFVFLEGQTVSRKHAELSHEEGLFFLKDLGSDNKTYLNEMPLKEGEKMLLKSGDMIRVGDYDLHFKVSLPGGESDLFEVTDSDILEVKLVKKMIRALDRENVPSFEIIEGPDVGRRFLLEGKNQEVHIGRSPSSEWRIETDVISRRHARVTRHWDAVEIEDLGSKNGVYVGTEKVRKKILRDGDRVHLGTLLLAFRNPLEVARELAPPPKKKEEPKKEGKKPDIRPPKPTPKLRLSPWEILLAIIGLWILVGSLWAILKIL